MKGDRELIDDTVGERNGNGWPPEHAPEPEKVPLWAAMLAWALVGLVILIFVGLFARVAWWAVQAGWGSL